MTSQIRVRRATAEAACRAPIEPQVWIPHTVTGSRERSLVVRSVQMPMSVMEEVQQAVWAADPGVALHPGANIAVN